MCVVFSSFLSRVPLWPSFFGVALSHCVLLCPLVSISVTCCMLLCPPPLSPCCIVSLYALCLLCYFHLSCCFPHVSAGLSLWCCASQCASLPLQWCFLAPLLLPIAHINSFASLSTYPVCFCAPSLHSFFILVTNPAKKKLKSACHFVGMCVRGAHTYKMTLPSFSEDFLNIIL